MALSRCGATLWRTRWGRLGERLWLSRPFRPHPTPCTEAGWLQPTRAAVRWLRLRRRRRARRCARASAAPSASHLVRAAVAAADGGARAAARPRCAEHKKACRENEAARLAAEEETDEKTGAGAAAA